MGFKCYATFSTHPGQIPLSMMSDIKLQQRNTNEGCSFGNGR